MESFAILEVVIGVVLVYLVLSLVCTSLLEGLNAMTGLKGKILREAVERLAGHKKLADQLYGDPEIVALQRSSTKKPSYIPPDVLTRCILNFATNSEWRRSGGLPSVLRDRFVALASSGTPSGRESALPEDETQARKALGRKLVEFIDEANGDLAALQTKMALWIERTNDRSIGWFKRKVNSRLVVLGFFVALVVNADTVLIFQRLSDDPQLRSAAISIAQEELKKPSPAGNQSPPQSQAASGNAPAPQAPPAPPAAENGSAAPAPSPAPAGGSGEGTKSEGATFEAVRKAVGGIEPFIGWSRQDPLIKAWEADAGNTSDRVQMLAGRGVVKLAGLLLTAFAISLGAPFWFDLLGKLMSIRKSVVPAKVEEAPAKPATAAPAAAPGGGGSGPAGGGGAPGAVAIVGPSVPTGPMAGFSPTAARTHLGNAYWLARAADLAYERDGNKVRATLDSWGLTCHLIESKDPGTQNSWRGMLFTPDTQGFIAADDNAVLVCFRGTEPSRPADIVTDLEAKAVPAAEYGVGRVHQGFKIAIDSVWDEAYAKLVELGANKQPVWFSGHSLGGALAVLAASRYDRQVNQVNGAAKKAIVALEAQLESDPDNAQLKGQRADELAKLRGRVGGVYTIGQPRVGDEQFATDLGTRLGLRHVRTVNNRDLVPRVPLRAMDYRHSGTVLYFDEFGRLHRDPGLWFRLLDTVVISRSEVEKAKEGVKDHNSRGYVDLLDKARKSTSALTELAVA